MLGDRGQASAVTCIACGDAVDRADAREYDKHGDRFDRGDKTFEHLCKPCYREISHQPRDDLERLLTESGAGETARAEFLARYAELATGARSETER